MPRNIDEIVFSLRHRAKPIKPDRPVLKTLFIIAAVLIVIGSAWAAYTYWKAPKGIITSPVEGTQISRIVEIEGYTKNLPADRRFIWVAADVSDIGLCWPKKSIDKPNGPFEIEFLEESPNPKFTVSLYAVDHSHHIEILKWLEKASINKSAAGFPLLPEDYRLDTVWLNLIHYHKVSETSIMVEYNNE